MARKTLKARRTGADRSERKAAAANPVSRSAQIRARIDPQIKREAEKILGELGLNPSAAISTFYSQIVLRRGLPFPVLVPNAHTQQAIEQARAGTNLTEGNDLPNLLAKLLNKRERSVDLAELTDAEREIIESVLTP